MESIAATLDISSSHAASGDGCDVDWRLPDDSPYLVNLAALWPVDPRLAERIDAVDEPLYPTTPTRLGPPTLARQAADGGGVQLHSRFDPIDEAARLIDAVPVAERSAFHVHGFGLGYHVRALFDRAADDAIIWILEDDLNLLRTAFTAIDCSDMIASGRLMFVTAADKASFFGRLMPHAASLALGFEPVVHQPSLRISPIFHQEMRHLLEEFRSYCQTTIATLVHNSKRTAENVTANLRWYLSTPSLDRLKDHYRGKPAIIVSAGPSLRKNKHLLKEAAGRAVIVAVQTTLQPLLEMGIEPHFVTSLDYHDICTRFFEKLPPDCRTELVAEAKASAAIFGLHPGPVSLIGNDFAEGMLREMKLNKARLNSGATVAHLAYYVADYLGCDPIIFVGQDLGFSDGLCYTPGTSYDDVWRPELSRFCTVEMKQWEQISRDRHILRRVFDQHGRPTYTEERLFTYLQHFERDFAVARAKIIDATEGGVLKRGAAPMTLAAALASFCAQPLGVDRAAYPGRCEDRLSECLSSLKARENEAEEIADIADQTLPLLEALRDRIDDQAFVNRTIASIDGLRGRMAALSASYALITQLTQVTELERFRADRNIAASKLSGTELQRRQASRDIENVKAMALAAQTFGEMVRSVRNRLQDGTSSASDNAIVLEAA